MGNFNSYLTNYPMVNPIKSHETTIFPAFWWKTVEDFQQIKSCQSNLVLPHPNPKLSIRGLPGVYSHVVKTRPPSDAVPRVPRVPPCFHSPHNRLWCRRSWSAPTKRRHSPGHKPTASCLQRSASENRTGANNDITPKDYDVVWVICHWNELGSQVYLLL